MNFSKIARVYPSIREAMKGRARSFGENICQLDVGVFAVHGYGPTDSNLVCGAVGRMPRKNENSNDTRLRWKLYRDPVQGPRENPYKILSERSGFPRKHAVNETAAELMRNPEVFEVLRKSRRIGMPLYLYTEDGFSSRSMFQRIEISALELLLAYRKLRQEKPQWWKKY